MDDNTSKSAPTNDAQEDRMALLLQHAKKAWESLQDYFEEEVDWDNGDSINDAFMFIEDISEFFKDSIIDTFDEWCKSKGKNPEELRKAAAEEYYEDSEDEAEIIDEDGEVCFTKCRKCNAVSQYGKELCLDCWKLSRKNK